MSKIGKEKKRAERASPAGVAVPGTSRSVEEIKQALEAIRAEPIPTTVDAKEQFFMDNVQMGEQLSMQG